MEEGGGGEKKKTRLWPSSLSFFCLEWPTLAVTHVFNGPSVETYEYASGYKSGQGINSLRCAKLLEF